jgi:asparagine synthase (glutamine-hydrolysing)
MCGIAGYTMQGTSGPHHIESMCDLMVHRGPNDAGYHVDERLALGMRRLSIIDLSTGHQPMYNEDRSIVTILNGEIYNYIELKDQYLKGHRFTTTSDTEVLVHLYEEMGIEMVNVLNGMFAFAMWDMKKRILFLARDRIGIKPLYYYHRNGNLVFASEMKPVLLHDIDREIDESALYDFINLMYIPAPRTMFKHIRKLEAGCYLRLDDEQCAVKRYWQLTPCMNYARTEEETIEELDSLFRDSIRLQLRSDVPIGTFLSGGLDSSAVVAFESQVSNHKVNTFSVGFEGAMVNELPYAKQIADLYGTNHHELVITGQHLVDYIPDLIKRIEEPHSDSALLPTLMLSDYASKFVKVVLNGTGGDELFGGYDKYITQADTFPAVKALRMLPVWLVDALPSEPKPLGQLKRVSKAVHDHGDFYYDRSVKFDEPAKRRILASYNPLVDCTRQSLRQYFDMFIPDLKREHKNACMFADIHTYLQDDLLLLLDKMAMAKSLEGRVPFLDHRIVELSQTIPSMVKMKGTQKKYLMKRWLKKWLPDGFVNRPKVGFGAPLSGWYDHELMSFSRQILLDDMVRTRGVFNYGYLEQTLNQRARPELHPQQLFSMLSLELWFRIFVDGGNRNTPKAHTGKCENGVLSGKGGNRDR